MKTCKCGRKIPPTKWIGGKRYVLNSRINCLKCLPFKCGYRIKNYSAMDSISRSEIYKAVSESISIAEVIRKLNIASVGSSYEKIRYLISRHKLNISHFKGKAHGTSKFPRTLSSTEVLTENSSHPTSVAKRVIIRNKLLKYKCHECGMFPIWNSRQLVLRLDHINGVRNDHRLSNLRFLCPNCDSQSPTFCGRNKKSKIDWMLTTEEGSQHSNQAGIRP